MTDKERADRMEAALRDILDPIGELRRYAASQGGALNGSAYNIAHSVSNLQRIAREALNPSKGS